jgi:Protein of unknown function (DUF3352)
MDQQPPPDLPNEPLPPPPLEGPASGLDAISSAASEPPRSTRRRGRILVAGLVVFALLIGGGAAAAIFTMRGSGEKLLSKVPASSDVVFTAYLDPSVGQKANLFLLASKFPALGSEQEFTKRFEDLLDQALTSAGLKHGDLSWVSDQVAVVVSVPETIGVGAAPDVALLVDTKDEAAAKATLQTLQDSPAASALSSDARWASSNIDGVDVSSSDQAAYAVFGGTAVIASSLDEMSAIIAAAHGHQPALEGSGALEAATAGLPDGKLALLYINPSHILSLLDQVPGFTTGTNSTDLSSLKAITGLATTVSAQPDGVALDFQAVYDPSKLTAEQRAQMDESGHPNPLLASIPSDALAVITGEQLDASLKTLADRLEATSPEAARMLTKLGISGDAGLIASLSGDDAVEATPDGTGMAPGGALILGTKDPVAMKAALDKLARGLSSLAESQSDFGSGSFSKTVPATPVMGSPSPMALTAIRSVRHAAATWVRHDYHGVSISTFRMDGAPDISYAVVNDQGVIGSSAAQVERVVDTAQGGANIKSSSGYTDAVGSVPSSDGSVWVDIQGFVQLVRQMMPAGDQAAFDRDSMPNLAPLKAFVAGSEGDSSHLRVRIFLKIG